MLIAAALAIITVCGSLLALDRRGLGVALPGIGFLFGSILVHEVLFGLTWCGVTWSAWNTTLVLLAVSWILFATASRRRVQPDPTNPAMTFRPHALDCGTFLLAAIYTVRATIAPVWNWDFWAIWGLKGRVFLAAGRIDWAFLEAPRNLFAHADYPLLLPLEYAYSGLMNGGWNDRWLGLVTVAFGLSALLVIRQLASEETSPIAAATIGLASTAFVCSSFIGLAEAPLIAYATAAVLLLRRAILRDDRASASTGAILLGGAILSKNEGLSIAIAALIALAFFGRRFLRELWPAAAVALPWLIARITHRLPGELGGAGWFSRALSRAAHPVEFAGQLLGYLPAAIPLTIAIVTMFFIGWKRLREDRFTLSVIALQTIAVAGVYLATPRELGWLVLTSWPRVALQTAPLLVFVVMVRLAEMFDDGHDLQRAEARSDLG